MNETKGSSLSRSTSRWFGHESIYRKDQSNVFEETFSMFLFGVKYKICPGVNEEPRSLCLEVLLLRVPLSLQRDRTDVLHRQVRIKLSAFSVFNIDSRFLGYTFMTYGSDVFAMTFGDPEGRSDPMNMVFPKVMMVVTEKIPFSQLW